MIPTKVITVDGRRAEVRSVPWRLYRRICSMSADVEEQLDLEEEVALRCATVEGLAREAMLDELSRAAVDAIFRAATARPEGDAENAPFETSP